MTDPSAPTPDSNVPPTPPQQPAPPAPTATAAPLTPEQDIQWGSFAHLGGVIGVLPSLIIWLVFKDRGSFTNTEAKEALNFQITLIFAYIISSILVIVFIGAILIWAVWIVGVVFSIIAFLRAKDGNHYRYPFAVRLIK
jgi:uncharacterized Tic20 family protein